MEANRIVEANERPPNSAAAWVAIVALLAVFVAAACWAFYVVLQARALSFELIFFVLFGGGLLAFVLKIVRTAISTQRFGDVKLTLEGPLSAGGQLRASLRLPPSAAAAGSLRTELRCFEVTRGRRGSTNEQGVWAHRETFPVARDAAGGSVAIAMDIPPDAAPPGPCRWELWVGASVTGVDFERTYTLDVLLANPAQPAAPRPVPIDFESPAVEAAPKRVARSTWVLIAANLVPVAGVLLWGWQVLDIVFLYWTETLVIGVYALLKIWATEDPTGARSRGFDVPVPTAFFLKTFLGGFLILHFGMFTILQGKFFLVFFSPHGKELTLASAVHDTLGERNFLLAVLAIVASHGYSFVHDYIGRGEYRRTSLPRLMLDPYKRVFATQFFLIFGGFVWMTLKSQTAMALIFVLAKTSFDAFFSHMRVRNAEAWPWGAPPAAQELARARPRELVIATCAVAALLLIAGSSPFWLSPIYERFAANSAPQPRRTTAPKTKGARAQLARAVPQPHPASAPAPAPLPAQPALLTSSAQIPSAPRPTQGYLMEIVAARPELARRGDVVTLLGNQFGIRDEHRVVVIGNGVTVPLEVLEWRKSTITARIPADAPLQPGRYFYRVERITPYETGKALAFSLE